MVSVIRQTVPHQEWWLDFYRFSNWKRLLRVTDCIKQFIKNSRSMKEQRDVGQLSPAENGKCTGIHNQVITKRIFQTGIWSPSKGKAVSLHALKMQVLLLNWIVLDWQDALVDWSMLNFYHMMQGFQ